MEKLKAGMSNNIEKLKAELEESNQTTKFFQTESERLSEKANMLETKLNGEKLIVPELELKLRVATTDLRNYESVIET